MNTFRSVSPFENELGNHMLEHLREALPLTTTYPTDISSDFCVEQERVSLNKTRVVRMRDGTRVVHRVTARSDEDIAMLEIEMHLTCWASEQQLGAPVLAARVTKSGHRASLELMLELLPNDGEKSDVSTR